MNRTQAIARVDEIAGLLAEMYLSGRCPRCEVLLHSDAVTQQPFATTTTRRIVHSGSCDVARTADELTRLSRRFGIPLEPVLLAASRDTWVVSVRRGDERADGGLAAAD